MLVISYMYTYRNIAILYMNFLYCFGISFTQQLTAWADTSLHLPLAVHSPLILFCNVYASYLGT